MPINVNFFCQCFYSGKRRPLWPELNCSLTYLDILEAHSDNKVGCPVGKTSHGDGRRPGPLWKQLSHDEPRDGTRSDLKEGNKGENGNDAQVRHPLEFVLGEQREVSAQWPLTAAVRVRWRLIVSHLPAGRRRWSSARLLRPFPANLSGVESDVLLAPPQTAARQ